MATFHGLHIYEILENGNLLTGVFINTTKYSDIDSEIARKKDYDDKGVGGKYECRYINTSDPDTVTHCTLEITKHNEVYEFVWTENGTIVYEGIGMKVGNNHIAVSYTKS